MAHWPYLSIPHFAEKAELHLPQWIHPQSDSSKNWEQGSGEES